MLNPGVSEVYVIEESEIRIGIHIIQESNTSMKLINFWITAWSLCSFSFLTLFDKIVQVLLIFQAKNKLVIKSMAITFDECPKQHKNDPKQSGPDLFFRDLFFL